MRPCSSEEAMAILNTPQSTIPCNFCNGVTVTVMFLLNIKLNKEIVESSMSLKTVSYTWTLLSGQYKDLK